MPEVVPVLTIDGPAGVGKGTLGTRLARRLGWHYLDSGALYRILALASSRLKLEVEDREQLTELARRLDVRFELSDADNATVYLDGVAVSERLRAEQCADRASLLASDPSIREALLRLQQGFRVLPGLIAEGRDMGTVVFPDAQVKVFLTASVEERARRRHKQLNEKGLDGSLRALLAELGERDRRDRERAVAPLRPASDAIVLDTTELSVEQALTHIEGLVARARTG